MTFTARVLSADMTNNDLGSFLQRSLRYVQESVRRSGPAAVAGYTLLAALLLLGGIGYAVDAWLGTSPWFLMLGLLLGLVVGFYELARTLWPK